MFDLLKIPRARYSVGLGLGLGLEPVLGLVAVAVAVAVAAVAVPGGVVVVVPLAFELDVGQTRGPQLGGAPSAHRRHIQADLARKCK